MTHLVGRFAGIDNVNDSHDQVFQGGRSRDGAVPARVVGASDLDINDAGRVRRRTPFALSVPLAEVIGGWSVGGRIFAQTDIGAFYEIADGVPVLLFSGLVRRASVVFHGGRWYVTDGATHKVIYPSSVDRWGMPVPGLSATTVAGSLPEGNYVVQASFSDAFGNEHGCCAKAAVTVGESETISVNVSAVPTGATHLNVYVGRLNQADTSFVAKVAVGSLPYSITSVSITQGDPPRTRDMTGPWAGIEGVTSFRAYLVTWRGNTVQRSEPGQDSYLFHGKAFMTFRRDVTSVVGLQSGMWVGTEGGLVWVTGEGPETWFPDYKTTTPVYPVGALVDGSRIPALETGEKVALFVTPDGLVAGLPGGALRWLTKQRYHFSDVALASIALIRQGDIDQIIVVTRGDDMLRYTEATTGAVVVSSELNSLANDTAALVSTALSNDASDERKLLANVLVTIAEQAGARDSGGDVALLIVPEVNSTYGDVATLATAENYIARSSDGTQAVIELDAAVTARSMTFANVVLPNSNYKIGLLNRTGQALAASGNAIFMSGTFSTDDVE